MEDCCDQFDVIVVGAGIMGSSTAYHLAKRGAKVLLLEQFDFLHHRGSSHGESRTLRATYPAPYYAAMVTESAALWRQAESEAGYKVYFKAPQLDMGPADNKSLNAVIASCRANSVPCRILSPAEVRREFSISLPDDWVGAATELGGVIKPTKAVSMYQTLGVQNGAVMKDNMEVCEIRRDEVRGGVLVGTTNGEKFWGKKCVVTVGAWVKKLVKRVSGLSLPVQPLECTVCYWKIKEGHYGDFTISGGFPTFASYGDPYIYGTPSLEFPGLVKIPVHGGNPCDPDRRTWVNNLTMVEALKEWIEGRFGDIVEASLGPVMTQSCMYSMTPDEDFVVDFLGGELGEEVVVAGGFSGHGFKMAPVVGRMVADLAVSGEAKGVELKHFRLGRFEGDSKGNVKDFDDQVKFSN